MIDLSQAFQDNYKRLRYLAVRIVGESNADDAVQNAFLGALRANTRKNSFKGQAAVSTWLYRITLNSALMMKRGGMNLLNGNFTHEVPEQSERAASPYEMARDAELVARVAKAAGQISPLQREAIELFCSDVLHREVAAMRGVSTSAAKCCYFRAVKNVQKILGV